MFTVLVIDDERIFSNLDDGLGDGAVTVSYARTSQEAIEALSARDYDEVWFDHDLGGEDTGMKVIRWMEDQHHSSPGIWYRRAGRFYVHTMNSVAAPVMLSRLKDFGVPSFRVTLPTGSTTIYA